MNQKTSTSAEIPASDQQVQLSPTMLLGKTALVTGSSRGIGASVARQLAKLGADVAINYRSKGPRAEEVADELAAMGRAALLIQGDITNAEDVAATFDQIQAAWGRLDFLILNASGGLEQDKAADYAM
jgi:3-oxoacyl-[acyl-carrier protein] reductase